LIKLFKIYIKGLINKNKYKSLFYFNSKNKKKKELYAIITSTGSNWPLSLFDLQLNNVLNKKARAIQLICDKALPACQEYQIDKIGTHFVREKSKLLCHICFKHYHDLLIKSNANFKLYSDYISSIEEQSITNRLKKISYQKVFELLREQNLLEHVEAGVIRYFGKVNYKENEKNYQQIYIQYAEAALKTKKIIENFIKIEKPIKIIAHHGIYVPQGVVNEIAKKYSIPIINYTLGYRKSTYIFNHDNTHHKQMINESIKNWEKISLTEKREKMIMNYIKSRKFGSNDWIHYQEKSIFDQFQSQQKYLKQKENILLLTNVVWDAQLHFNQNIYENMIDWLIATINFFIKNNNYNLIIRVHPAEKLGTVKSREPIKQIITDKYPKLPENIKIIDSNEKINTYDLLKYIKLAIVYGTKMGIEIPCYGINTIVCGESWAKNKNFTIDPKDKEEYINILNNIKQIPLMSKERINNAKKYAYHLFFRRMIKVNSLENKITDKKDKGMNIIINGIINNKKFYDEKDS
jgi:hypothetical protein